MLRRELSQIKKPNNLQILCWAKKSKQHNHHNLLFAYDSHCSPKLVRDAFFLLSLENLNSFWLHEFRGPMGKLVVCGGEDTSGMGCLSPEPIPWYYNVILLKLIGQVNNRFRTY